MAFQCINALKKLHTAMRSILTLFILTKLTIILQLITIHTFIKNTVSK